MKGSHTRTTGILHYNSGSLLNTKVRAEGVSPFKAVPGSSLGHGCRVMFL